jgi:hypothetical protein
MPRERPQRTVKGYRPGSAKPARYDDPPEVVITDRNPGRNKELSRTAENLMAEFYKRYAFALAIVDNAPVEWAGNIFLNVGKARSYEVRDQLRHDGVYNPWIWFRDEVMKAMRQGKIARGWDTVKSPLADAFFTLLAGGRAEVKQIRLRYARQAEATVEGARRADEFLAAQNGMAQPGSQRNFRLAKSLEPYQIEVNDYLVHSHLLWRMMKEEGK